MLREKPREEDKEKWLVQNQVEIEVGVKVAMMTMRREREVTSNHR